MLRVKMDVIDGANNKEFDLLIMQSILIRNTTSKLGTNIILFKRSKNPLL